MRRVHLQDTAAVDPSSALKDSSAAEQNYRYLGDAPRHPQRPTLDLADDQIMVLLRHEASQLADQIAA